MDVGLIKQKFLYDAVLTDPDHRFVLNWDIMYYTTTYVLKVIYRVQIFGMLEGNLLGYL
jgi:hypothetical protein